jgi:hypothetical protein
MCAGQIVLDIAGPLRMMAGPDGDAFGRGVVDMSLAIAEAMDGADAMALTRRMIGLVMSGNVLELVVCTADGGRTRVTDSMWHCGRPPSADADPPPS